MENANLQVRNFDIRNLREMTIPVPPSGSWANSNKQGIGLFYYWGRNGVNSFLNFDEMDFQSMDIGVELNSKNGLHQLRATASVVDETGVTSSIRFGEVGIGYNISIDAYVDGLIEGNYIEARRNGMLGAFFGEPNAKMNVLENVIKATSSSGSWSGTGIAFSTWQTPHDFLIKENEIQAQGVSSGRGIWISGAFGSDIQHNYIHASGNNAHGIMLERGGESLVKCNTVEDVDRGIDVASSVANEYGENELIFNKHDLYVTGDAHGNGGSFIRWNTMKQSSYESVKYEASAITGPQLHSFFNAWQVQSGDEAIHLGGTGSPFPGLSRFHYPVNALLGSVYYPQHDPNELFESTTKGYTNDFFYCGSLIEEKQVPQYIGYPSDSIYNEILLDTNSFVGYTAAQQLDFDLQLYDLINKNPGWKSNFSSLSDFFDVHETGYVGANIALQDSTSKLTEDMKLQRESLNVWQTEMDSIAQELSAQITSLSNCNDPECVDSVSVLINDLRIESDSFETLISDQHDLFVQDNHNRISDYMTLNSSLSDTALYEWSARIVIDITLRLMKSDTLTPQDKVNLETIAMSCDEDASSWVYAARALCWRLYQEYYEEQNCVQAVLMNEQKTIELLEPQLMVNPNPANREFRVEWLDTETSDGKFDLHIFDLNGREISKIQGVESGVVVDASRWVDGIYILKLLGQEGSMSGKVIINH